MLAIYLMLAGLVSFALIGMWSIDNHKIGVHPAADALAQIGYLIGFLTVMMIGIDHYRNYNHRIVGACVIGFLWPLAFVWIVAIISYVLVREGPKAFRPCTGLYLA